MDKIKINSLKMEFPLRYQWVEHNNLKELVQLQAMAIHIFQ